MIKFRFSEKSSKIRGNPLSFFSWRPWNMQKNQCFSFFNCISKHQKSHRHFCHITWFSKKKWTVLSTYVRPSFLLSQHYLESFFVFSNWGSNLLHSGSRVNVTYGKEDYYTSQKTSFKQFLCIFRHSKNRLLQSSLG